MRGGEACASGEACGRGGTGRGSGTAFTVGAGLIGTGLGACAAISGRAGSTFAGCGLIRAGYFGAALSLGRAEASKVSAGTGRRFFGVRHLRLGLGKFGEVAQGGRGMRVALWSALLAGKVGTDRGKVDKIHHDCGRDGGHSHGTEKPRGHHQAACARSFFRRYELGLELRPDFPGPVLGVRLVLVAPEMRARELQARERRPRFAGLRTVVKGAARIRVPAAWPPQRHPPEGGASVRLAVPGYPGRSPKGQLAGAACPHRPGPGNSLLTSCRPKYEAGARTSGVMWCGTRATAFVRTKTLLGAPDMGASGRIR